MLYEVQINDALSELGYRRLRRFAYKALWSTPDVEHFLYFSVYGRPREFLTADFGLRNEQAQAFAFKSVQAYGGELYQLARHDVSSHCSMRFSLGQLASWHPRASLHLPEMSEIALAEKIKLAIQDHLYPIIRGVMDTERLLYLLLADAEPYSWVHSNGAIRAAMIVSLATKNGMDVEKIRTLLQPYSRRIAVVLAKGSDPAAYIKRIIDDAAACSAVQPMA